MSAAKVHVKHVTAVCMVHMAVAVYVCLIGCHAEPSISEQQRIGAVLARIIAADNNEDIDAILRCYTTDAELMPPEGLPIHGVDSIKEHYLGLFSNYDFEDLRFEAEETIVSGKWAVNTGQTKGRIIHVQTSDTLTVSDKYMMLLEKQAGMWKIKRLIWNANPKG